MARILIHTLLFPPDNITNAYLLADLARELKKCGHELTVLTTTPHYNRVEQDLESQPLTPAWGRRVLRSDFGGMPCYHVRVPPQKGGVGTRLKTFFRFHVYALIMAWKMKWRFDVVLSQSPPLSIGLVGSWIARLCHAKSVYIVQDIFPDGLVRQGKIRNAALIGLLRWMERRVYAGQDEIVCISAGFAAILRPRVPARIPIEVIPNFVDVDLYRPLPRHSDFSKQRGLDDDFVVSYAGNMGNAQDFNPVLTAARQSRDLPIKYLLVGDGIKKDGLAGEVRAEGLANVEVWDYQPRAITPWINAASDVCLVLLSPHVGSFGFPSKVYTLMASCRPIILVGDPESDIAALVRSSGAGWVIASGADQAFADLIRRLAADPAALTTCGERGLQYVRENCTAAVAGRRYHERVEHLTRDAP